jgi:hypothetical protein
LRQEYFASSEFSFSNPLFTSRFMDGREAKKHIYPNTTSNRAEGEGIKTSLFMRKDPSAEVILAISDAAIFDRKGNPHLASFPCIQQLPALLIRCITPPSV